MRKNLFLLLKSELNILKEAKKIFLYSIGECEKIGLKDSYTYDELDKFEALTSRFARLNDILIGKVIRTIDRIELEPGGTVRDRINRAEKKGIIESADTGMEIRMTRNDIAHEYLPEAVKEIFKKVLILSPHLVKIVERVVEYSKRY